MRTLGWIGGISAVVALFALWSDISQGRFPGTAAWVSMSLAGYCLGLYFTFVAVREAMRETVRGDQRLAIRCAIEDVLSVPSFERKLIELKKKLEDG